MSHIYVRRINKILFDDVTDHICLAMHSQLLHLAHVV